MLSAMGQATDSGGKAQPRVPGRGRLAIALAALLLAAVVALLARAPLERAASRTPPHYELWFYYYANLTDDQAVRQLEAVWRRAAAAGYTHVMLADHKFARLDQMDARYFENVGRVKRLARELGLEIVPGVFQIGRSSSLLAHDLNLAEGLPVRDALFEVRGGEARVVPDPPVAFGPRPDLKDPDVALEGGVATVRDNRTHARLMYRVPVHPFRCYHVSVEVLTEGFSGQPLVRVTAGGHVINFMKMQAVVGGHAVNFIKTLGVQPTQDWTVHDIAFNSLGHSEVEVYFGAWHAARGTLALRNWKIEEAGPFNVLRRAGAPCVVQGYVEGRDYEPIRDPGLGMTPWRNQYDVWHEPPPIRTRLPDGTRLRISWYQAAVVFNGQVMCCVSEPAVLDLLREEAARMKAAWGARGYLMMYDEIRALNWDESCRRRGMTPGALLADNARRCLKLLEGSTVYVWNDMFDPYHNAVRDYYLVNGDLSGSWEGLTPEVVIVNWNAGKAAASLRFFASRGHRQILAGYYDRKPEEMRGWLEAARGVKGVTGVMYTTWRENFGDLEAFARVCREGS
jgi:hypothetical protein